MKAVALRVTGRVQGVYYRQTCRSEARSLDLVGWVRNLADGSVEILAQGEPSAIDKLIDWAWSGPSGAVVSGVESETVATNDNLHDFHVQPGPAR